MAANLVANVTVTGNLFVATTITVDTQSTGGFSVVNPNIPASNIGTGYNTAHTAIVLNDGTVRVCGNNQFGQLGQNDLSTRSTLVSILGISSQAIAVAVHYHTAILMNDGTVRVCGDNQFGQLGQNNTTNKSTVVPVLGISSQAIAVACGFRNTLILMNNGTVRAVGYNAYGQFGLNDTNNRLTPVPVPNISSQAIAVSAGSGHIAVLLNDGTVRVCGDNFKGQLGQNDLTTRSTVVSVLGISSQAIAVACGTLHTVIILNDGTVRSCGSGAYGQLGYGGASDKSTLVPIIGISSQAIAVACGFQHTVILMNDGTVRGCGRNDRGQLGQNDTVSPRLTVVSFIGISQAIAVACGNYNTSILMNDGSVRVCGNNSNGQLAQNDLADRSTVVPAVAPSKQRCYTSGPNGARPIGVADGRHHTAILMNDGTVRVCGYNIFGQLGQNDTATTRSTVVSIIGISSQAIAVACGGYHTAILMNDGTVRVCGRNATGQLGQNNTTNKSTPVPVIGISSQAIAVSCGYDHTAILMNNGTVRVFGNNGKGQLGLNDLTNRSTPVPVIGISSQAIAVACGGYHTAILMNDGTIRICGYNNFSQLGQNDTVTTRSTVVSVLGISSQAIAVACGAYHTAILMNDGTVRVCGRGDSGQLGQNNLLNKSTVVSVLGISSQAIAVSCGYYFTAILMTDGTVRTFGNNIYGQLGQNDTSNRSTPVPVIGISSQAIAVSCGSFHFGILLNDGTVRVCGYNGLGQLGLNDVAGRSTVVTVPGLLPGPVLNMGSLLLGLNPAPGTAQTYQLDLSTDNARKATTTTWATGSDMRIKSDIQSANLARCSEIIDSLDLKYFSWTPNINTEDRHSLGWIAQEVEQYFPKSIVTSEAHGIPDFKNLNSDQLIKAMYGALKNMIQQTYPPAPEEPTPEPVMEEQTDPPVEQVQEPVTEEQTDPPVEQVQEPVMEEQTDPPTEAVDASNTPV